MSNPTKTLQTSLGIGAVVFGGLIAVIIMFSMTNYISEHEVGIEVDNGEVVGTLTTGLNFTKPFISRVVGIDTTMQAEKIEGVSAASKDNYSVANSTIEYNFRIPDDQAESVYRKYPNFSDLIRDEVEAATKDVMGQYRMLAIPNNREKIGDEITETVKKRLTNEMGINFSNATLAYYEWTQSATRILSDIQREETRKDLEEEKLKRQKVELKREAQSDEAENKREKANLKARLEREEQQSESKARQKIDQARADAEAERIRAEAEAEAMQEIAQVLSENPQLIERQRIEKWDGKLPVIGSNDLSSRIDVDLESLRD